MEIRYINSSDNRNAISQIYEESWKNAYSGIIPQDYLDSIPKGQWAKNLDTPGWHTMVCIENEEYIGTSSFCKSRFEQYPDSGEVISIYFLPDHVRKGYGSKLMEAVICELQNRASKRYSFGFLKKTVVPDSFMKSLVLYIPQIIARITLEEKI